MKLPAAPLWEHRGGPLETDPQTGRAGIGMVEDTRSLFMGRHRKKTAEQVVNWDGG